MKYIYKKTPDGFCVDQGHFYHFLTRVPNPSLRVEQTRLIYTLCTVHLYTALDSHIAFLPFFLFFFFFFVFPSVQHFRVHFSTFLVVSGDHGSESCFLLSMNHHPATPGAELLRSRLAVPVARFCPGFGSGDLLLLGQGKTAPGTRALPLSMSCPSSLSPPLRAW